MQTALLEAGVLTVNEVRAMRGLGPMALKPGPDGCSGEAGDRSATVAEPTRRNTAQTAVTRSGNAGMTGDNMKLEAMAVTLPEVAGHPNRAPFQGVLTLVDEPSTKPPSGARGHRVILTRGAALAALPSLLGMAVDYVPSWDGHDSRRKCGIITQADVEGSRLRVAGYLFAKDFPEVERQMRECLPERHGNVLGAGGCARGGHARGDLDADARDLYRRGDSAARESGVSQHLIRTGGTELPVHHQPARRYAGARARGHNQTFSGGAQRGLSGKSNRKGKHMESQTGENMVALTESMERMEARLEAAAALFERAAALIEQQESERTGEVRKIVAAVETSREAELQKKLEAAEQTIAELRAQMEAQAEAPKSARKTVPASTAQFLAKQGIGVSGFAGSGHAGCGAERAESRTAHRGEGAVAAGRSGELAAQTLRSDAEAGVNAGFFVVKPNFSNERVL